MSATRKPTHEPADPDTQQWPDVAPTDTSPATFGTFGTPVEADEHPIVVDPKPIIPDVDRDG